MRALLHAVAYENQRIDPALLSLIQGVLQDPANLCQPGGAADAGHAFKQRVGIRTPGRGFELHESAVKTELYLESTEVDRLAEHLGLNLHRPIPCRLAARRRIHGEDEAPAPAGLNSRRRRRNST
jgi:hypothetical protein